MLISIQLFFLNCIEKTESIFSLNSLENTFSKGVNVCTLRHSDVFLQNVGEKKNERQKGEMREIAQNASFSGTLGI